MEKMRIGGRWFALSEAEAAEVLTAAGAHGAELARAIERGTDGEVAKARRAVDEARERALRRLIPGLVVSRQKS